MVCERNLERLEFVVVHALEVFFDICRLAPNNSFCMTCNFFQFEINCYDNDVMSVKNCIIKSQHILK
jgi:hypothetical protein